MKGFSWEEEGEEGKWKRSECMYVKVGSGEQGNMRMREVRVLEDRWE